jgi:hypothetical protein
MRRLAFLVLLLPFLGVSGCGDEDSTASPSVEFPRAFRSLSESCTWYSTFYDENGLFVEETTIMTMEASAEVLFAGPATITLRTEFDPFGAVNEGVNIGVYRPSAVNGAWPVTLTPGPVDGAFTATGTGTGELSDHSIDFDLEPLSDGCGYTSSGTIR